MKRAITMQEWFAIVSDGINVAGGTAKMADLESYFHTSGQTMDGTSLDPDDFLQSLALIDQFSIVISDFEKSGHVRRSRNVSFTKRNRLPIVAPSITLTDRGIRLARQPRNAQVRAFIIPAIQQQAGLLYDQVKGPVAVSSTVLAIAKIALAAPHIWGFTAAAIALVVTAVFERMSRPT